MLTRSIALILPLFVASLTAQKSGEEALTRDLCRTPGWSATSYGHEYDGAPAHSLEITVCTRTGGNATLLITGGEPFATVSLLGGFASQGWSLRGYRVEGFLLVQDPLDLGAATLDANGNLFVPLSLDGEAFGFESLFVQAVSFGRDFRLSNGLRFDFRNPKPPIVSPTIPAAPMQRSWLTARDWKLVPATANLIAIR